MSQWLQSWKRCRDYVAIPAACIPQCGKHSEPIKYIEQEAGLVKIKFVSSKLLFVAGSSQD
jgi:hypothetical protein